MNARPEWLEGLNDRMAAALLKAGFTSKAQVRYAIEDGKLAPNKTPGIGPKGWKALVAWSRAIEPARLVSKRPALNALPATSAEAIERAVKVLRRAGWTLIPPPED